MQATSLHLPPRLAAVGLLLLAVGSIGSRPIAAQEDPFGEGKGAPAAPAGTNGGVAKASPADPTLSTAKPLLLRYLDENKPTTPEQLAQAAKITLNIGEVSECQKYLAELLAAKPDNPALAALSRKLGPDFFLRLQREKDIQPEGGQVGAMVLEAVDQTARDPARLAQSIADLGTDDPAQRALARSSLAEGRTAAVLAMIPALADPSQANVHRQLQFALLEMKHDSEGPLVGSLESDDEELLIKVIDTLGAMNSTKARPRLIRLAIDPDAPERVQAAAKSALAGTLGTVPEAQEAELYLVKLLDEQLEQAQVLQPSLDESAAIWQWDAAEKAPVSRDLPPGDAALLEAKAIAAELHHLAPQNETYLQLRLMTALEADKILAGLDHPLPEGDGTAAAQAVAAGPDMVSDTLALALQRERVVAAIAAAEVLGKLADSRVLTANPSQEAPLAQALRHSDRRLRITAALAIAKIAPQESFAGASRVVETLAHFAGTGGGRRVLIGHPRGEAGQTLVGYMNEAGYEAEVASSARAVQKRIVENADYEFLLLSDTLGAPGTQETVQWLRRDYRTARLPVGVLARRENLESLRDALEDDRLTYVFPAVADLEVAVDLVRRLERIANRNLIGRDERVDLAAQALDALAGLAQQPKPAPSYDMLRHEEAIIKALTVPGISPSSARLLGLLGSAKSQTALLEFASHRGRHLADRQFAAAAFADAVKRRGVLLTRDQVRIQYDRYNASETEDAETQAVLGSILDAIESRTVAAASTQP